MKAKTKHIEQLLKQALDAGHYDIVSDCVIEGEKGSVPLVKVYVGEKDANEKYPAVYSFFEDDDWQKDLERRRKALDRRLANRQNYGDDRGRAAVYSDNQTAKDLALLNGRPDYISAAYHAYTMSQKAPERLRRYVYHNLIVHANLYHQDAEHFMLQDIQPYTFEVLPPAWRKHLNAPCPELQNVSMAEIMEPLTPAFQIGKKMARKMINGRFVLCKVVAHEFNYRYSLRGSDRGANPFVLEYRVKEADDNSRHPYIFTVKRDNAYPAFHAEKLNK